MAFYTWVQTVASEGGTFAKDKQQSSATVSYLALPIGQPTSIGFVRTEALGVLPSSHEGLWLNAIDVQPNADGTYTVTGQYRPRQPREPNFSTYRLASSGEMVNVKYSLETIASYAPGGGEAPENDGVLNEVDGVVQGIEIPAPGLQWIETHYLPEVLVTRSYLGFLTQRRGYVNSSAWKGFAEGEVQFQGLEASAEVQDAETEEYLWTLTFTFGARPNETGIQIGNDITVASKQGWDWLEVRYQQKAENGRARPVPIAAYVERIFDRMDFKDLGVGE